MATKLQLVTAMYDHRLNQVTTKPSEWLQFLQSAGRNYKLSFEEQILVHAQRPEATAVLEIEKWNTQFGRWVNRGATGIAVVDRYYPGSQRLKYYFDVSDTHESRHSRTVPIWEMTPEYVDDVIETLEASFGELSEKETLSQAIMSAASNAVDDNITDYLSDLYNCREDSFLEELDELNVEVIYTNILKTSVAFMLMSRCGIDSAPLIEPEDFRELYNFNTPDTIAMLGNATSAIAEMGLREISSTVLNLQKGEKNPVYTIATPGEKEDNIPEPKNERSFEDGSLDLQQRERVFNPRPDAAGGAGSDAWEIRVDAPTLPDESPQGIIQPPADELQIEPAPDGNRADGARAHGIDGITNGGGAGRNGADESRKSDGMGRQDEQHPSQRGGNDTERTDLQLIDNETESSSNIQSSLSEKINDEHIEPNNYPLSTINSQLISPEEQLNRIEKAEGTALAEKPSAFFISQQIIDEVLTSGGNKGNSIYRIISYFKKDHNTADNAAFLQKEYSDGGKGFIFNKNHVSVWFDESGIRVAVGDTALNTSTATHISWEQAAKRTRELLDLGRYAPQGELDKADGLVLSELTSKLYFIYRDGVGKLPQEWTAESTMFHNCVPIIAEQLSNPETLRLVTNKLDGDWQIAQSGAFPDDFKWMNYLHWHVPDALRGLQDLQRESLVFTADESASTARPSFITQDETDEILVGGAQIVDSKFRVYSFFLQEHTAKEKIDFLKHEYGIGGGSKTGGMEMHDGKGIALSREINHMPYDKVILPWNKVAKRIDELIADGRYMSRYELEYIPEYEMGILARDVYSFYHNQPEKTARPYPYGAEYSDAIKVIRPQLDESERVAKIIDGMAAVLDNTADFDRHYEAMKKSFEDLTAFQNGTFSLFTPAKSAKKETIKPTPVPKPSAIPEMAEYEIQLGAVVHISMDEYEIYSFDDTHVVLRDLNTPLFMKDMPREQFDRKIQENPLNNHLRIFDNTELKIDNEANQKALSEQITEDEAENDDNNYPLSTINSKLPKPRERYEIEGRHFIVDTVDTDPVHLMNNEELRMDNEASQKALSEQITENEAENDDNNYPLSTINSQLTGVPAWEKPKPRGQAQTFDAFPNVPMSKRSNFKITDDNLGAGGAKTKFRANMDAIHLLHDLELDGRLATPEEQEILSRYVGWGSLAQAFDENNASWADEFLELQTSLPTDEYESARTSTLNAHYTSPVVIKAMYKALENMGFKSGNILDPGCGVGNFQGLLPDSMSGSKVYGIEIDPITGRICKQLYQKNSIAIQGYEKTPLPDSFFDLAIGNVPFGGYGVSDKKYDKHKFRIHEYFFAKTLDKVRLGGVVAFITSKGTMDKQNPAVRKYIAQRAELLGAIRLPNNAFLANAGTQVTSDIIFLQKRDRVNDVEPDWLNLDKTEDGIPVNSYFVEHPEMMLGTMSNDSGTRMYGNENSTACLPFPDRELSDLLDEAIQNIHGELTEYELDEDEQEASNGIPADPTVRNFSFCLADGEIYYRENSMMYPREMSVTAQSRVKGMIEIRNCVRSLIEYQTNDYSDSEIKSEQLKLNRLYDGFTRKYGLLNDRANAMAFDDDSSYPLLCSLEVLDEDRKLKAKADMFHKRTIKPQIAVTSVDTASEALVVSIAEKACVDLGFMASLMGGSEKIPDIVRDLDGVIFKDPETGSFDMDENDWYKGWQTADEYLSGNVREKLQLAKEAQANDTAIINYQFSIFNSNVQALEAVQPKDLTAPEISVRLGATWLPTEVVRQFVHELLNTPWRVRDKINVLYSPVTAEWNVTGKSVNSENIKASSTYGTKRINAYWIIENTLNLRDVRIYDTRYVDGKETRVLNKTETAIAQDKQDIIKAKFTEWIWADPERREWLCKLYNEQFNSIRPREYDGQHIKFSGMNPEIKLDKHQINAAARHLYGGNALYGHVVGAGKSFEMIAAAMESKRLGLSNKAMFVVPNNIIGDFASDFFRLYPSANILMTTKKDFEKKNRRKFCARIATGDYDGIIIGHSQFEKIPVSVERQRHTLERQIRDIAHGIADVKSQNGERYTIKQMEKTRKALEVKLTKLNDQSRKDDLVTFEELGVDRLFVDEADLFKNLFLITKMRNVGGIAQTEAQKASDLFMKTRYLDELTGNRGVVFATGTPVSNTMAELYTMQRYLQYDTLVKNNLQHFDCWASTFGETVTAMELTPEGTGFQQKTRFANFYNLPELMAMFKEVADIQTADMLKLPVPKANYHVVTTKPSDLQKEMVAGLSERADLIRRKKVDSTEDNMLLITNDGRKLALDQRIMNPLLPDFDGSKVNACVGNVFRIWDDTKDKRLTQLIFCDMSTPKGDGRQVAAHNSAAPSTFSSVYEDLRDKLIAKGVPESEIAFIHQANNEKQKAELFAKVRAGQIRILLGSTAKMGAGTNVQDKLIALHDVDCPWRPRDLEQRAGRIVRRGNKNPEVDIYRYVTEGTFDAYLYQMIENKQKFISQVFTSKSPARVMQEIDDTALSYAEIKALATGNPLIIERCNLEAEVNKLKMLKSSHLSQLYELEDKILKHYPAEIARLEGRITGYTADIEVVKANTPINKETFPPMKIGGNIYTDKKLAGSAIIEACKAMTGPQAVPLGTYRGFQMELSFESFSKEYHITLKNALSHTVALGTDIYGNITRLDNELEGMESKQKNCEEQLKSTNAQLVTAKTEADAPFPREQELQEKTARLAELTIALKLDEKDHENLDGAPDEGDTELPQKKSREKER